MIVGMRRRVAPMLRMLTFFLYKRKPIMYAIQLHPPAMKTADMNTISYIVEAKSEPDCSLET